MKVAFSIPVVRLLVVYTLSCAAVHGDTHDLDRTGTEKARAQKIIGPDNCASCHVPEAAKWRDTRHCVSFNERHRTARSKQVLRNLDLKSMKRSSRCRNCQSYGSWLPRILGKISRESHLLTARSARRNQPRRG